MRNNGPRVMANIAPRTPVINLLTRWGPAEVGFSVSVEEGGKGAGETGSLPNDHHRRRAPLLPARTWRINKRASALPTIVTTTSTRASSIRVDRHSPAEA